MDQFSATAQFRLGDGTADLEEFSWGSELESWPDPEAGRPDEAGWAGRGFTRRNEESST